MKAKVALVSEKAKAAGRVEIAKPCKHWSARLAGSEDGALRLGRKGGRGEGKRAKGSVEVNIDVNDFAIDMLMSGTACQPPIVNHRPEAGLTSSSSSRSRKIPTRLDDASAAAPTRKPDSKSTGQETRPACTTIISVPRRAWRCGERA